MRMCVLEIGKIYEVKTFVETCEPAFSRKLMAMGFTPGAQFRVIRKAPLGDPFQVQIRGVMMSIRKEELAWMKCGEVQ